MGKIQIARIDDRLIHGQVMTRWSKGLGTNAIYIVDDQIAQDEFMKMIYVNTNATSGLKIEVLSIQQVVDQWNENQFNHDIAILLFKSVESVTRASQLGLPIEVVNVGGLAKTNDRKFVITSAAIDHQELTQLFELQKAGIQIYFQTVPDSKKVTLDEAAKLF